MPDKSLKYRKAPTWKDQTMLERLAQCRAMLHLYDMLTQDEAHRVYNRIMKLARKDTQCQPSKSKRACRVKKTR